MIGPITIGWLTLGPVTYWQALVLALSIHLIMSALDD